MSRRNGISLTRHLLICHIKAGLQWGRESAEVCKRSFSLYDKSGLVIGEITVLRSQRLAASEFTWY